MEDLYAILHFLREWISSITAFINLNSGVIQTISTVILTAITCYYAFETRKTRKIQQNNFDKYAEESEKSRKENVRPFVYGSFFFVNNLGKFFLVLRNVGVGPAFDIHVSYSFDDGHDKQAGEELQCQMLAVDKEKPFMTIFSGDHVRKTVTVGISYVSSFGEKYSNTYEFLLSDAANNPVPTDFQEFRRKLEDSPPRFLIEANINEFLKMFSEMNKKMAEIHDELSSMGKTLKNFDIKN